MLERRGLKATEEMIDLFARGLELVERGAAEIDYDVPDSSEQLEFARVRKRLEWRLIGLHPHCASVFDVQVDGEPFDWLRPEHMMWQDWGLVRGWRRALMDALDARGIPNPTHESYLP